MASLSLRHPRNAPGDLFVDTTCIDCDTCARLAPTIFGRDAATKNSIVRCQPEDPAAQTRSMMALLSCPVGAIGTVGKPSLKEAREALPHEVAPGVYDCGYASRNSYGASSWLLRRPQGNVLVDSPRAVSALLQRLEALGGVRTMFLTHRDDVADHAAFRARFGCERVIHRRDAVIDAERLIDGDEPVALAEDLLLVPVPGHTRGSMALLVGGTYLFTGDHLWGDEGELCASRSVCWWSWEAQRRSMRKLLELSFAWVFPGHGQPLGPLPPSEMRARLERLIERMDATP